MKKKLRLYNVILPVWMLWVIPLVWVIAIPANLAVDTLVVLITLAALGHRGKGAVLKKLWWKVWLLGFLGDCAGTLLLMGAGMGVITLGYFTDTSPAAAWWYAQLSPVLVNSFRTPVAFLVMLLAVALSGVCIFFLDRRAMRSCDLLTAHERTVIALVLALVTAPWLYFVPLY